MKMAELFLLKVYPLTLNAISASHVVGLSHFDGSEVEGATKKLIEGVKNITGGKQWGR